MNVDRFCVIVQSCHLLATSWTLQTDLLSVDIVPLHGWPSWARTTVVCFVGYALAEITTSAITSGKFWLSRKLKSIPSDNFHEIEHVRKLRDSVLRRHSKYVTLDAIKEKPERPERKERVDLFSFLTKLRGSRRIIILGEPGSGKTTTIEAFTYNLCSQAYRERFFAWFLFFLSAIALFGVWKTYALAAIVPLALLIDFTLRRYSRIPILIDLRQFTGASVPEFLSDWLKKTALGESLVGRESSGAGKISKEDALRKYVKDRHFIWLLDGLNEIRGEYLKAVEALGDCFRTDQHFTRSLVIVTSRTGEDPFDRMGFDEEITERLQILELDTKSVMAFIQAYRSKGVPEADASVIVAELRRRKLLEEPGGLARNPFWLKIILASIERNLDTRNQGKLFEAYARKLLERAIKKSPTRPYDAVVPLESMMESLAGLAFFMRSQGSVGFKLRNENPGAATPSVLDTLKKLTVESDKFTDWEILHEAQAATLAHFSERDNFVEFSHELLQDFFAAYKLRASPASAQFFVKEFAWWLTLIMLGGLIQDHPSFVQHLLALDGDPRVIMLAVSLLDSVDSWNPFLAKNVAAALSRSLRQGFSNDHKEAARKLCGMPGSELARLLGKLVPLVNPSEQEEILKFISHLAKEDLDKRAIEVLAGFLTDGTIIAVDDILVEIGSRCLMSVLGYLNKGDSTCQRAADILGRIGDSRACDPLCALLSRSNIDSGVACAVAQALGRIGEGRAARSLVLLLERPENDVQFCVDRALPLLGVEAASALIESLKPGTRSYHRAQDLLENRIPREVALEAFDKAPSNANRDIIRSNIWNRRNR